MTGLIEARAPLRRRRRGLPVRPAADGRGGAQAPRRGRASSRPASTTRSSRSPTPGAAPEPSRRRAGRRPPLHRARSCCWSPTTPARWPVSIVVPCRRDRHRRQGTARARPIDGDVSAPDRRPADRRRRAAATARRRPLDPDDGSADPIRRTRDRRVRSLFAGIEPSRPSLPRRRCHGRGRTATRSARSIRRCTSPTRSSRPAQALELGALELTMGRLTSAQLAGYRLLAESTLPYVEGDRFVDAAAVHRDQRGLPRLPVHPDRQRASAAGLPGARRQGPDE